MSELSEQELGELYRRYAPVLLARCQRILRNEEEALDAVQDTFARVIRHRQGFRSEASPLTWMYKISTNLCLNRLRDRKGRQAKLDQRATEMQPAALHSPDQNVDHEQIRTLLQTADPATREVVIYTYFDDCTQRETAMLTGLSVPTVRKRLRQFVEHARFTMTAMTVTLLLLLLWSLPC